MGGVHLPSPVMVGYFGIAFARFLVLYLNFVFLTMAGYSKDKNSALTNENVELCFVPQVAEKLWDQMTATEQTCALHICARKNRSSEKSEGLHAVGPRLYTCAYAHAYYIVFAYYTGILV